MKTKLLPAVLIVLVAAFALSGCEDLLTSNFFARMDAPQMPTSDELKEMPAGELLDRIETLIESASFYDDLALDPETKSAILSSLADIYSSAESTTEELQQASLLAATIEINSSGGRTVIDEFVSVIGSLMENEPAEDSMKALIKDTIVAAFSVIAEEDFVETVEALQAAAAAFTVYGNSLTDLNGDGKADAPPGSNIGSIAQDAIVAFIIDEAAEVMGMGPPGGLWGVAYDAAEPAAEVGDLFDPEREAANTTALLNILEAAGLDDMMSK